MSQIAPLRDATQQKGMAIQAASKRKASPKEACKIIKEFVEAEAKFIRLVVSKQAACKISPEVPTQLKANHAKSEDLEKKVCAAAGSAPPGPAGPTLDDVINSPVIEELERVRRTRHKKLMQIAQPEKN